MVLMIDNYCLSQLRAIINYSIDKEVINISNPCSKVKNLVLKLQKLPII
jgi:hypothetical protein